MLDTIDLPVICLDQEQLVQMWNRRASDMSGKTNEDDHQDDRSRSPCAAHPATRNGSTLEATAHTADR